MLRHFSHRNDKSSSALRTLEFLTELQIESVKRKETASSFEWLPKIFNIYIFDREISQNIYLPEKRKKQTLKIKKFIMSQK